MIRLALCTLSFMLLPTLCLLLVVVFVVTGTIESAELNSNLPKLHHKVGHVDSLACKGQCREFNIQVIQSYCCCRYLSFHCIDLCTPSDL